MQSGTDLASRPSGRPCPAYVIGGPVPCSSSGALSNQPVTGGNLNARTIQPIQSPPLVGGSGARSPSPPAGNVGNVSPAPGGGLDAAGEASTQQPGSALGDAVNNLLQAPGGTANDVAPPGNANDIAPAEQRGRSPDSQQASISPTLAPAVTYDGFSLGLRDMYTRTNKGLPQIGGRFFVRVTSSEANSSDWDVLLGGVKSKAEANCKGDYSVSAFQFYGGHDSVSKQFDLQMPWVYASVECATPPAESLDPAAAMTLSDLTKNIVGAEYFEPHSIVLNARYDSAFPAVLKSLDHHGLEVQTSDKNKGIVVTRASSVKNSPYLQRYVVVLDPEADTTTRMSFELVSASGNQSAGADLALVAEGKGSADARAQAFAEDVDSLLNEWRKKSGGGR